jgi:4-hydroxybenzoate polyprenyltransferase
VKEFLQGRRAGFALRSHLGFVAVGLGIAVTLADLMAWFALGSAETNGYVIVAQWLCVATLLVAGFAAISAVAERWDVIPEERGLAQIDMLASAASVVLYGASAVLRSFELGAAAASPAPFLLAIGGLIVLVVDAALAANMYSSREWEEIEDVSAHERQRRRRA